MPQDVEFYLPFPHRVSTDMEGARQRNMEWVLKFGLAVDEKAWKWYESWDMPKLAAYGYPYATGDELSLCVDAMAFFFLFDDQFDGPLGWQPDKVSQICQAFIDIAHSRNPALDNPCTRAFADIWLRCREMTSAGWQSRAAHEWEYYFATYAHEAINRRKIFPIEMERFLEVRRGMAGTGVPVSLGELAARIDVPPAIFHSPQLRIMRQIAIDVTIICNDVYSFEKESSRGDMDNFIVVVEEENKIDRVQAVQEACRQVNMRSLRFADLSREIPDLCEELRLSDSEIYAAMKYVEVMESWIRGYHEWETETLRYVQAPYVVPNAKPGFLEDLFLKDL